MEKGDLSEKSEHRACMHDHTWLRLAKSPNSMLQQPSLLQRLRYGAATRKCVTGIVREPFGGGGAFVVAEDMGRMALEG